MKEADRQRAILLKLARMSDTPARSAAAIPTGFTALDEALGAGGLPRGCMVEIFGPAGCGKTTLAIQITSHLQKDGLTVAWIDADHTFDPAWAARLGADTERIPLAQPDSAEQALEITRTLSESGAVDLVVVDSAAALVPRLEIALEVGSAPGLHSRVMASGLRKLSHALLRSCASVLFLNQARTRMEPAGGGGVTSAGSPPLKLYAAVRVMLTPLGGGRLGLRVLKNKMAVGVAGRELAWQQGSGFAESP
jgi:recombination protein RecA